MNSSFIACQPFAAWTPGRAPKSPSPSGCAATMTPGVFFRLLSSCDRRVNEAVTANRRAASPEFRGGALVAGACAQQRDLCRGTSTFAVQFLLCSMVCDFFPIPHLGRKAPNRRALRQCLMPNWDLDDQPGRRHGIPEEQKGTLLHVQGSRADVVVVQRRKQGGWEKKNRVAAAASRLPCQRIKSDTQTLNPELESHPSIPCLSSKTK
ncbi:hypothetical protein ACQKWADRAFT_8168 [Trichoderma austrokoningii]